MAASLIRGSSLSPRGPARRGLLGLYPGTAVVSPSLPASLASQPCVSPSPVPASLFGVFCRRAFASASDFDLPLRSSRTTVTASEKRRGGAPLAASSSASSAAADPDLHAGGDDAAPGGGEGAASLRSVGEAAQAAAAPGRRTRKALNLPDHFPVLLTSLAYDPANLHHAAARAVTRQAGAGGLEGAAAESLKPVQRPFLFLDPVGVYMPVLEHCSQAPSRAAEAEGEGDAGVGVEDIGRLRIFDRHRLVELLPEGLAGELPRDIEMIPSATSPVGVMLRKATLELQLQLEHFARAAASPRAASSPRDLQQRLRERPQDAAQPQTADADTREDAGEEARQDAQEEAPDVKKREDAADAWKPQLARLKNDAPRPFAVQRGFLIDGHRGVGKSCVLNYLIPWARENSWLVVYEPMPSRYAREIGDIKRSSAGVYIQSTFSQEFLERLGRFNRRLLKELPVDRRCYGQAALDGVHRLYAERSYHGLLEKAIEKDLDEIREQRDADAEKKTNKGGKAKTPKDEGLLDGQLREEVLLARERLKLWHAYRREVAIPSLKSRLPDPASVWEIAEFGLQNEAFATQVLYEIWEQLKKQTRFNVLVAVDEWNECFPVSEYVSMRYEGTRYNGHIPAFHLSTPRLLSRFDQAEQFKRGLKLCATSWRRSNRRDYRPELLGVREDEIRTVRNFSPFEFANFVAYYHKKKILHEFPQEKLEYFYMLSGGNGFQARRLLTSLY